MSAVLHTAEQVTHDAAKALASGVAQGATSEPTIVVLNPLNWTRDDSSASRSPRCRRDQFASVIDDQGNRIPAQISDEQLLFVAHDVPGYRRTQLRLHRQRPAPNAAGSCVARREHAGERASRNPGPRAFRGHRPAG